MSTTIPFAPSTSGPFTFKPTIDGTQYTAQITLNVLGGRYYLNLYDQSGDLVIATAVASSGPQLQATLTWEDTGVGGGLAIIETAVNHNVPVGRLANVYISQTDTAFDGYWQALAISATEMTYALSNPDVSQPIAGQMRLPVNLVAGADLDGWLIFDYPTSTFEWE